jgi:hypothetical protein
MLPFVRVRWIYFVVAGLSSFGKRPNGLLIVCFMRRVYIYIYTIAEY